MEWPEGPMFPQPLQERLAGMQGRTAEGWASLPASPCLLPPSSWFLPAFSAPPRLWSILRSSSETPG